MSATAKPGLVRRILKGAAVYGVITIVTLVIFDLVLIGLKLFPPFVIPGDPELGWVTALPTGKMEQQPCVEYSTRERFTYARNEDAVRTSYSAATLRSDTSLYTVGVTGDSQTDLCAANEDVHFGVLEKGLRDRGIKAAVFARGAGKYSPLQAYLAVKKRVVEYHADALVLNLYTGNDVYDMLRLDDRPHFVADGAGYRIAPPIWYQEAPPGKVYRSRVLFALRTVAHRTGIRNAWVRVRYLRDAAREQGRGFSSVLAYMNDLRKASSDEVEYPTAFSAQMLNQQLFFHHFPGSKQESIKRVKALLELVRRENPNMTLVLSPLPSYQLVREQPVDSALLHVMDRMPFTYEQSVAQEAELYEAMRGLAAESGWVFVDVLTPLREYKGKERLFNSHDYHYLPVGSHIIGRAQAEALASHAVPKRPASRSGR